MNLLYIFLFICLVVVGVTIYFYTKNNNNTHKEINEKTLENTLKDNPSRNDIFEKNQNKIKQAMNKAMLYSDTPYDLETIKIYLDEDISDEVLVSCIKYLNENTIEPYSNEINSFDNYRVDIQKQIKDYDIKNYKDSLYDGSVVLQYTRP